MASLLKIVTFVKYSGENCERVIDTNILIPYALWEYSKGLSLTLEFAEYIYMHCRYVTMVTEDVDIGIFKYHF